MLNFISRRFATIALLLIFSSVVIFHLLVLIGFVPLDIIWGGRLKSEDQMISFEITSIALNLVMLTIVAMQAGLIEVKFNPIVFRIAFWCMFALFFMNTIGNLFSNNELEKVIFTPITFLLSAFCLRLAINK